MEQSEKSNEEQDEMRPEYDETVLKNGIRGKYYQRYMTGNNLARLAPGVHQTVSSNENEESEPRSQ